RTRCSTHRVIEILEKVSKQNIHSLDSIGFGGITQVKLTRLPVDFAQWALDHYDVESQSFLFNEGRRLQIGEQDVRRVYGLPNGNKPIVLENAKPTMKKCAVDMGIPNSKKGKGSLKLTLLKEKLIQENDIDLWRKYFILYCLGGLLCPISHPVANLQYLPLICKLQSEEFREYSWCTHIAKKFNDGMVEAKKKWTWICADLHLLLVILIILYIHTFTMIAAFLHH
ncbi:hypothetical protein LINGRAPRIM_LOCUS3301, partial [Linum grandiflorum]